MCWLLRIDFATGSLSVTFVAVSVANNLVHTQSAADYGYYAFGEKAQFVYCLLRKIKKGSVLPLVAGAVGRVPGS